jgi:hypothetical protein
MSDVAEWNFNRPKHGWVCFFCGDTMRTPGEARDHFGLTPAATVACRIKDGDEKGLAMALRKAEQERDELQVRLTSVRAGLDKTGENETVERWRAQHKFW